MKIEFGKHSGTELTEIPSGYLRWLVENFEPTPREEDVHGMTSDQIKFITEQRRDLIAASEDELLDREQT